MKNILGILKKSKKADMPPIPSEKIITEKELYISSAQYFRKEQESLLKENPYYSLKKAELIKLGYINKRIYKYKRGNFLGILVPDPTNKHDRNVIKICVGETQVGFINREDQKEVCNLMRKNKIDSIQIDIQGGPCKIIAEVEPQKFLIERENIGIYMHLKLLVK